MKACPFCLAEIPIEARKCKYCGEWVEKSAHVESASANSNDFVPDEHFQILISKTMMSVVFKFLGMVIGLVVLAILFCFLWEEFSSHGTAFSHYLR